MEEHLKKAGFATYGPLGFPVSDNDAREIEKLLETGEYGYFKLNKSGNFDGVFDKERAEISVITDDSVDEDKEIIPPGVIDFSPFEKYGNPAFYNHRYDLIPVGRALWLKKNDNGWKAKTTYLERPQNHPEKAEWLGDTVWHLIKNNLLRGKSIGGLKKMRPITEEDLKKNPHWQGGTKVAVSAKVWEYSICPRGCNSNAVVEVIAKSGFKTFPSSMLADFPELKKALEKVEEEIPLIKSSDFKTQEDFIAERKLAIQSNFSRLQEEVPTMIEDHIKRVLGKVI